MARNEGGYPLHKEFVQFIVERENIRRNKEAMLPRPWTKDEILATYRFTNVHREDDRVSRFVRLWLQRHDPTHRWFAAVAAALFNNQATLTNITTTLAPFKPDKMRERLAAQKATGVTVFNAAYIVSTNGLAMDKVDYLLERVLAPLWAARGDLRPHGHITLAKWHNDLVQFDGLGSFLAAQVVAIMKYEKPLSAAQDWWTFAASGPGSRRGLNRVMGVVPEAGWKAGAWEDALAGLATLVKTLLVKAEVGRLHNQDLQNCLCEFDKYRRAVEGGRPKQLYREIV